MRESYMRRCFELARQGLGQVSPNPLVGALLVKNGRIIGEGYHRKHGAPHAEPACFANCSEDPTGATLFVNLEPCCHTKKLTPPCVPLVIQKKVAQVIISNLDPNPAVAGEGVRQLRAAGIEVVTGVLEAEGERLNEAFFHRMRHGTPFVHLKSAATLDGKCALPDGTSQWITGEAARTDSHWGRLGSDAVLIGAQTLRDDNPSLSVRIPGKTFERVPWRVVLTRSGHLPASSKLFTDELKARTLVVTHQELQITVVPEEQIIRLSSLAPFPYAEFYQKLQARGIQSLWLEGGPQLQAQFLKDRQVQRVTLYLAPKLMGQGLDMLPLPLGSLAALPQLRHLEVSKAGDDIKISGVVAWPE